MYVKSVQWVKTYFFFLCSTLHKRSFVLFNFSPFLALENYSKKSNTLCIFLFILHETHVKSTWYKQRMVPRLGMHSVFTVFKSRVNVTYIWSLFSAIVSSFRVERAICVLESPMLWAIFLHMYISGCNFIQIDWQTWPLEMRQRPTKKLTLNIRI
jgi:hypothetical protein